MTIQKWKLLTSRDVSPDPWFPVEKRSYQLPDGRRIDDFYVTTVEDVSQIVPVTDRGTVILIREYKPGADEIMIQFPAGRREDKHADFKHLAQVELEEETGIRVSSEQLTEFAVLSGFTTKGTEKVHMFLARGCELNASQKLDSTEEIEILEMPFDALDRRIAAGEIHCAQTIAAWTLVKVKGLLS